MEKVCFAVLTHDHRDCIEDLISNLYHFEPKCHIILFNGGTDSSIFEGLNVHYCPYSMPIKYRRPQLSTILMMRWVTEQQLDFDYFVLVDHDILLLRSGFSSFLKREMADCAYMGLLKGETGIVTPDLNWRPGQRFLRNWSNGWAEIFGLDAPWGCFNPGQVFRKCYVERFLKYEKYNLLLEQIEKSNLSSLGEMIFPTMAQALNFHPKRLPYHDRAIRYRKPHSSVEVKNSLQHRDIYFIHPVPMNWDAQLRHFIRLLMEGREEEAFKMDWRIEDVEYDYKPYRNRMNRHHTFPDSFPSPTL